MGLDGAMRTKRLPRVSLFVGLIGFGMSAGCGGGYTPATPATSMGDTGMMATVRVESVPGGADITFNGEDMGSAPTVVRIRISGGVVANDVSIHLKWQDREVDYNLSAGSSPPPPILRINQNGGETF
jgi:hypothetical protein